MMQADQPGHNVIVQQPGVGGQPPPGGQNWMPLPAGEQPHNCPPGLEYLTTIDQLLVQQKVELLEAFTGFETKNQYIVKNILGQQVFYAKEESGCLARQFCGSIRSFDMQICDNFGTEVIHLNRPLNCTGCCCCCCLQTMEVTAPPGTVVGSVKEEWSFCTYKYKIEDEHGNVVLRVQKPVCVCHCCSDVVFKVLTPDCKKEVGQITKQWTGLIKESFTDADNFSVKFPMDLDVKLKATMLGACFLIDFVHFEDNKKNK